MRAIAAKYLGNNWAILALALLIRWGAFLYFYFVYKTPGGIAPSPHATEVYDLLARELLAGHGFAAWHFAYRPPLYPIFIAAVYALFQTTEPLAPILAQSLVSASVSLFACNLAKELGADGKTQFIAGLLCAIDPASIDLSLVLVAETLANFFIAIALIFWVRLLNNHQWRDVIACSSSLILAALSRPNAVFFFVVVAAVTIIFVQGGLVKALLLTLIFVLGVTPWYFRNYAYNGIFTFATTSDFNLLFYKAVSVEQWATGKSPFTIQADFAHEIERRLGITKPRGSYDEYSMWPYLVPADTRAYRVMREMAWEVYSDHLIIYLFLIPVTVIKLLGFRSLASEIGILRITELPLNVTLYGAALAGCIIAWQRKSWRWLLVTVLPIAYFLLVPAITGGVQDTRARANVTICFALLAADGLLWVWALWRNRR